MAIQIFVHNESTQTSRRFYLFLVDETDGKTPETGEAGGQSQLSKNGSAFSNTSATLVAVGNGSYYVELTVSELSELGKIIVRFKSANTLEFQDVGVVGADDIYVDSHSTILSNQSTILSNQSTILSNQSTILSNQSTILSDLDTLDIILRKVEELLDRSIFDETKIQEGGGLNPIYPSLPEIEEGAEY